VLVPYSHPIWKWEYKSLIGKTRVKKNYIGYNSDITSGRSTYTFPSSLENNQSSYSDEEIYPDKKKYFR